jgi:hypothetical protein
MMFNVLNLFGWTTWLFITIAIIFIFWLIYGGKQEYEFIGVQPLSTPKLFEQPVHQKYIYTSPLMQTFNAKPAPKELSNKGEEIVADVLEEILSSPVQRNIRPDFLRNPETGKNMEIDCFNEEYAVAVEYNGIQHYKFPSVFYKNKEDFMNQVYRDRLKRKLCDENGVYLISVPYWVDMFNSQDKHLNEKNATAKIQYVPREVRYKRIYDYLHKELNEYFQIIFPQNENDLQEDADNRWSLYDSF